MKIIVMGAGVIGVTTAYQLLKDGHEVTVIERNDRPAAETSFANAGLIAPGHAYAWSSPRAPGILLKSLWRDDQALRFRFSSDPLFWRWCYLFLRQCNAEGARRNTLRKHKLCVYSQAVLNQVVAETGVAYDQAVGGILYFYRTEESFTRGPPTPRSLPTTARISKSSNPTRWCAWSRPWPVPRSPSLARCIARATKAGIPTSSR